LGVFKKLKTSTEKTVKKSVNIGKTAGEKTIEIGKDVGEKGVDVTKKGVQKVRAAFSEDEDPLKILKIRYAKGEITKTEYVEMKAMIS
jgi:hypothetical protein